MGLYLSFHRQCAWCCVLEFANSVCVWKLVLLWMVEYFAKTFIFDWIFQTDLRLNIRDTFARNLHENSNNNSLGQGTCKNILPRLPHLQCSNHSSPSTQRLTTRLTTTPLTHAITPLPKTQHSPTQTSSYTSTTTTVVLCTRVTISTRR